MRQRLESFKSRVKQVGKQYAVYRDSKAQNGIKHGGTRVEFLWGGGEGVCIAPDRSPAESQQIWSSGKKSSQKLYISKSEAYVYGVKP